MQVVYESQKLPDSAGEFAAQLRTGAASGDVVQITLHFRTALRLARQIDDGVAAHADLRRARDLVAEARGLHEVAEGHMLVASGRLRAALLIHLASGVLATAIWAAVWWLA